MVVPPRCGARVGYRQYYAPIFRKENRGFFVAARLVLSDPDTWLLTRPIVRICIPSFGLERQDCPEGTHRPSRVDTWIPLLFSLATCLPAIFGYALYLSGGYTGELIERHKLEALLFALCW